MIESTQPVSAALRGYAEAGQAARPGDGGMAAAAGDFVAALSEAEGTVKAGLTGGADSQAVVQALAATEIAVQTAVTVRDRVVEAYQEILRMPV